MSGNPVTVTYESSWRRQAWDTDVPSRPAWFVSCAEHPGLGKDSDGEPWGYATSGRAHGVASRHLRAVRHARKSLP
jgi:hypothetical protein